MAKPDAKLTDVQREFIVQRLACYDSPKTIVDQVREEFGVVIARQTVEGYDPVKCKRRGKALNAKWVAIYEATRELYEDGKAKIGIANQMIRLERWERLYQLAVEKGNLMLAADMLERGAKDAGGAFSNRRELTGKDGKDLPTTPSAVAIFQLPDNGRGQLAA